MKLALLLLLAASAAAKDFPTWIREAAAKPAGKYPAKVTQEVLLSEERLTVTPDGRRTMTERKATRIVQTTRTMPDAFRTYNTKNGRIRDFRAWLIQPGGQEIEYDKKRIVDIALDQHDTYQEERAKVIECESTGPGAVFAYEVTEEEDSIFTTYEYSFQSARPAVVSRFILTVPRGWEVRGTLLNHADFQPQVAGDTYTWELRDLPSIETQPYGPAVVELAPRLGVTYYPSSGANPALTPMKDWTAVSAWFSQFAEPSAAVTPAISAKANELTAGAKNDLDKIRALAGFVQKTSYVSVQMNLEHGGGYTPHPAADVLSRNYGDCKDKATLLRALLKASAIDSYAVSLYSGDRDYVREQWPSPMQFNHAIVAIKLNPGVESTAVIEHPKLGRLLIFDPTDPFTKVGSLDEEEQGSYALIVAPHDGALVKLPQLPPAANRIELTVEGKMTADGQAEGHVASRYFGQSASTWRAASKQDSAGDVKKTLEAVFARRLGSGVNLEHVQISDNSESLDLALDLRVTHFAQNLMGNLLVLKPGSLAPDPGYNFPKVERTQPIQLDARLRTDKVTFHLPPGFAVDDMPSVVDVAGPYGSYHATWKAAGDVITLEQTLEVKPVTVPAAEYAKVRDFFDRVTGGQYAAVVLAKH